MNAITRHWFHLFTLSSFCNENQHPKLREGRGARKITAKKKKKKKAMTRGKKKRKKKKGEKKR